MDGKKIAAKLEYLIFQELTPNFDDIVVDVDINLTTDRTKVDSYFIGIDCDYKGNIDSVDTLTFSKDLNKISDLVQSAASAYIINPDGKLKSLSVDDDVFISDPRINKINFIAEYTHKFSFNVMVIPDYE